MLLATSGCVANLLPPAPIPITLSQPAPLQRPALHTRRVTRAAHLAPPNASGLSEAQTAEKEKLFRSFVDWQGAQDNAP
jgi:hypothetical protein